MSIFKRHKHIYKLLSVEDVTETKVQKPQDYLQIMYGNGLDTEQITNLTIVVEKCSECQAIRQNKFTGHHAKNIKENYEMSNS